MDELKKVLGNFGQSLFERIKEIWNQIKKMFNRKTFTSKKKHHPLVKQIMLKTQVDFRKPRFAMARSNL